jgi:hypothetical protein
MPTPTNASIMTTMEAMHAGKGKIADNRDSIPIQEVPMQDHHLAVVEEEEEAKAIVNAAIAITIAVTLAVVVAVTVTDAASLLSTSGARHTSSDLFLPFFCFLIVDC